MFFLLQFLKNMKKVLLGSCIIASLTPLCYAQGLPKEYYNIKNSSKAKEYFSKYIYSLVEEENKNILKDRKFIKNLLGQNILKIDFSSKEFKKLLKIKNRYKIKKLFTLSDYLKKIDIIPPALAIAQAAVESGWGKSRFTKKANNIFGQWTYNKAEGILPSNRDKNAKHYIKVYKNLKSSMASYMLNLNKNGAYKAFRDLREKQRKKYGKLNSIKLSQTLINYSGIGKKYLSILKNMIEQNKLKAFDKKFYSSTKMD